MFKLNVYVYAYFRPKADIALIGLAVMGQNLILNMDSKGFVVCAFNRTVEKVCLERAHNFKFQSNTYKHMS